MHCVQRTCQPEYVCPNIYFVDTLIEFFDIEEESLIWWQQGKTKEKGAISENYSHHIFFQVTPRSSVGSEPAAEKDEMDDEESGAQKKEAVGQNNNENTTLWRV